MKRILSLIMAVLLVVGLAACGSSSDAKTAQTTTKKKESAIQLAKIEDKYKGKFRVGFSRSDITPTDPTTPLSGYGNSPQRIATGYLSPLSTDATVVSDEKNNTVIIIQIDIIGMYDSALANNVFLYVSKKTGVPIDNIIFNMSHTHSAPDTGYTGMTSISLYDQFLLNTVSENAVKAMNDRFPSKMYYGETETYHHNFVRHYWGDDGTGDVRAVGDNHWDIWYYDAPSPNKHYIDHIEEVDPTLYAVKFDREGADDVIITSFRAHNTTTGGSTTYVISADWVGKVRDCVEEKVGECHCMYLQGNAGNVNPSSRIEEENDMYKEKDYIQFAETLEPYVETILGNMTELKTGTVAGKRFAITANTCRDGTDKIAQATLVQSYWQKSNDSTQTKRYAYTLGIVSQYAASNYISRAKRGATVEVYSSVIVIGELALTFAPGEMFSELGHQIIEKSPYKYTIPISYSGHTIGYIPTDYAYEYGCYEVDITQIAKGTASQLIDEYAKQLAEIKKNTK